MTDHALPTPDGMLQHALADLQRASLALSDARDWLNSDWRPVGTPLTAEQSRCRAMARLTIVAAKREIDPAAYALNEMLRTNDRAVTSS